MKTLGIVAHSVEGAALCFVTACHYGAERLGGFMHPNIVMSAIPMGLSMPGWESGDHREVARHLGDGVRTVARAGADFFVCPDNTAHIVLEKVAVEEGLPIPGLHIAEVVCAEISQRGWKRVGLLGTKWTMTGVVYERALALRGLSRLIPEVPMRERLNHAIFAELCKGIITPQTTAVFVNAAEELKERGAECVILGCTEIPLVLTPENSPLPVVDSTRLLARRAADVCAREQPLDARDGWVVVEG
jgi:aspartate racemase